MQLADALKKIPLFLSNAKSMSENSESKQTPAREVLQEHSEVETSCDSTIEVGPVQTRNHPYYERVEGFVDVGVALDGTSLTFRGLLVPGFDREGKLRNRYIFLDHRAEKWFADFCWEIVDKKLNIPVRVRVSNTAGDTRAWVKPCTHSRRQAMHEWGRLQEEIRGYPQDINECRKTSLVCEFVYRKVAAQKNLKIVKWVDEDFSALAVNDTGIIFRMSGARDVDNFVGGIANGHTTLEKEIEKNVTVYRTYRL